MYKKVGSFLFYASLLEIFIGGGGAFFKVEGVSLRMILFVFCILIMLIQIAKSVRISNTLYTIMFLFIITTIISSIIGVINYEDNSGIISEVLSFSYYLLIPFYYYNINSTKDVDKIIKYVKFSSLLLVVFQITLVLLLKFNLIHFQSFYLWQAKYDEIMFRSEYLIIYKGFLYLCIGFFAFVLIPAKYNWAKLTILLIGIILTLTRGFIFFTLAIVSIYLFLIAKGYKYKIYFVSLVFLFSLAIVPYMLDNRSEKSTNTSDNIRIESFNQIHERTSLISIIVGNGFGYCVPIRPVRIENTFVDILHKQGVLVLTFWIYILIYIVFQGYQLRKHKEFKKILFFVLSTFFIYIQSNTNPFLNNSIGMPFVLVSLVIINKYKNNSL